MAVPMPGQDNLYYDNPVLYECGRCKNSFVLGKMMQNGMGHKDVACPYCHRHDALTLVAEIPDERMKDIELLQCSLLWKKPQGAAPSTKPVVRLTQVGEQFYHQMEAVDELEQEATRLRRWQQDLREQGKMADAEDLEERIQAVEDAIEDMG